MAVTASVKFYNEEKGFGFFKIPGEKADAFVHISSLQEQGFESADMEQFAAAEIEIEADQSGRLKATKVVKLGGKFARPEFTRSVVDRKGDLVVVKVTAFSRRSGRADYYEIQNSNGQLMEEGIGTLAEARSLIGHVILPPQPVGYGQKTNVPGQGPAKGPGGQEGKTTSNPKKEATRRRKQAARKKR